MLDLIIFFLMFTFPFFYLRAIKDYSWNQVLAELLPRPQHWKKEIGGALVLLGLLLFAFIALVIGMFLVESILASAFGISPAINDLEKVGGALKDDIGQNALGFFASLFVTLFIEEFFFRAFLIRRIGMIPSTLIFSVAHIGYGSIAEILGVFVLGMILAYWYKKNNSLIQNYIGHVLYDFIAIALYMI